MYDVEIKSRHWRSKQYRTYAPDDDIVDLVFYEYFQYDAEIRRVFLHLSA